MKHWKCNSIKYILLKNIHFTVFIEQHRSAAHFLSCVLATLNPHVDPLVSHFFWWDINDWWPRLDPLYRRHTLCVHYRTSLQRALAVSAVCDINAQVNGHEANADCTKLLEQIHTPRFFGFTSATAPIFSTWKCLFKATQDASRSEHTPAQPYKAVPQWGHSKRARGTNTPRQERWRTCPESRARRPKANREIVHVTEHPDESVFAFCREL